MSGLQNKGLQGALEHPSDKLTSATGRRTSNHEK
jgi:hypothetical protein